MNAEDPFLLSNASSQKLRLERLRSKLSDLKKEKAGLKNKLTEEKLSYLMTTSFADAIPDPRKQKAVDMKQIQDQIMEQLTLALESRSLQQVLSNYRLCGWTTFTFQHDYIGMRLDTFYDRHYHEPYFLFIPKDNPSSISRHTFPTFIPTTQIERTFLPDRIDPMLRILQDFLLAYVSRREQIKALEDHIDKQAVEIKVLEAAKQSVTITQRRNNGTRYSIDIRYKLLTSMYPSEVTVTMVNQDQNSSQVDEVKSIENIFKSKLLLQAYTSIF